MDGDYLQHFNIGLRPARGSLLAHCSGGLLFS